MWPFSSEEEQDENLLEFQEVATLALEEAPDATTGLAILREAYSSYEFKDQNAARETFSKLSDQVRGKFDDVKPFSPSELQGYAPITFEDIAGTEPLDDNSKLEAINNWEKANYEYLDSTDDLTYLQSKEQLINGIKAQASAQRREMLGAQNYQNPITEGIVDSAFRAASGSIGALTDLVGLEAVNDYLQEHTSTDYDDSFFGALMQGTGQAATAMAVGAATGGVGAAVYLGAQGLNAVKEVYDKADQDEASAGETALAVGVEAASQAAQTVVGAKVFGEAGKALAKGVTKQVGPKLTSVLAAAGLEGLTEGAGQVASNVASNVVSVDDVGLFEGVATSAAVGGILGGAARGLEVAKADPVKELEKAVADQEGTPPPPIEAMPNRHKAVDITEGVPVAKTEDGSEYLVQDGKLYFSKDGKTRQTTDHAFLVEEADANTLRELTTLGTATPDGSVVALDTDGKTLYVEHPFISDDGTNFGPTGAPGKKVAVKAEKYEGGPIPAGKVVVQADPILRDAEGKRRPNFFVGPTKVASSSDSAGAASVTLNTKEHGYAKKMRETYGPIYGENAGLETTQTITDEAGNVVGEKRIGLMRYFPTTTTEAATAGSRFVQEKGLFESIAWLESMPEGTTSKEMPGVFAAVRESVARALMNATVEADYTGDTTDLEQLTDLDNHVTQLGAKLSNTPATTLALWGHLNKAGIAKGGTFAHPSVTLIKAGLNKEADVEISQTIEPNSNFKKIKEATEKARQAVADVEKAQQLPEGYAKEISSEVELETLREINTELTKQLDPKKSKGKRQSSVKSRIKANEDRIKQIQDALNNAANTSATPNNSSKTKGGTKSKSSSSTTASSTSGATNTSTNTNTNTNPNTSARVVTRVQDNTMRVTLKALFQQEEKLRAARFIRDSAVRPFTTADEKTLRDLYSIYTTMPAGEARHKVGKAIYTLEAKYLPSNDSKTYALFNYWRANALSGPDTTIKNTVGGFLNTLFTISDYGITGILNDATFHLSGSKASSADIWWLAKGMYSGAKAGAREAKQVLTGERVGRMKLDTEAMFYESPTAIFDKNYFKGISAAKKAVRFAWWPFKSTVEMSRRAMAAGDSFFYRTASEGAGKMLAHIAAVELGLKGAAKASYIEDRLFNTAAHAAMINQQLAAEKATLASVGISLTPTEEVNAFYERMESLRATKAGYGPATEMAGLRAVFMQEPTGVMGALHEGIQTILKSEFLAARFNGKTYKVAPVVLPFTRTVANVTNALADATPLGFLVGAPKRGRARKAAEAKLAAFQAAQQSGISAEPLTKSEEAALYNHLEQRQIAGRALTGSAFIGVGYALASMAAEESDEPWIQFTGSIPAGEYKKYEEQGRKPYSMKINGITIPLQYTPAALLPAIIAPLVAIKKNGGDVDKAASAAMWGCLGAITEMSFLKSVADIMQYLKDVDEGDLTAPTSDRAAIKADNLKKNLLANQLKPFIPASGFLSNVERWIQENPQDTFNNFKAKMFSQIPVVSGLIEDRPALNSFGEPITKGFFQRNAIGSFISWSDVDPVYHWMSKSGYKLSDMGPVVALSTEVQKAAAEDLGQKAGYKDLLDEDESRQVLQIAGPEIKAFYSSVMKDASFQKYSEDNQEFLNKEVNKIRARAKLEVLYNSRLKAN